MNRISDSMFHSRSTACKKPYGAVPAGQAVEFSVYPQRAQGALHVTLWIEEDGCQAESHPLHWCGYQGSHDRYTVTYTPPHPGLYWYYFSVELADGLHYCARGYGGQAELLEAVGDKYQLTVYDGEYHTPRWFGEGITYNIFPDRFCRDKAPEQPESEGVVERVLHQNWDDIPVYLPDEHGEILNNDIFRRHAAWRIRQAGLSGEPARYHHLFQSDLSGVFQSPLRYRRLQAHRPAARL